MDQGLSLLISEKIQQLPPPQKSLLLGVKVTKQRVFNYLYCSGAQRCSGFILAVNVFGPRGFEALRGMVSCAMTNNLIEIFTLEK